jgi:hypothetical protein
MRRALAIRRWAGMGVIWDATEPEPLRAVVAPAPQVSLTVIHVEAGAYLNVGGVFVDPRLIAAVRQQPDAITTRGTAVSENGNGGEIGVTDDKWAETHGNRGK